jgi:uncharacterized membrane protein YesL
MQGFTGNNDLSHLQATMRAIELASTSIQVSLSNRNAITYLLHTLLLMYFFTSIFIFLFSIYFQMQINPAASEAIILSLGQSSQPYNTCHFILGQSLYILLLITYNHQGLKKNSSLPPKRLRQNDIISVCYHLSSFL